jgi:hypothetical protein
MATHPPGTVGILSGDLSRFSVFQQSLLALTLPPGTQVLWVSGQWVAAACNTIIANMWPESAWLTLLSDDHVFAPDMLLRLLDRQVDIVAPLVCLRRPPFSPSLFHQDTDGEFVGYTWRELAGKTGLLAVDSMGGPGCIVRREVLDATGPPWFTGQAGEHPREDLTTFSRWRGLGYQPYVDLDVTIGHCVAAAVTPKRAEDGSWRIGLWSHVDIGEMVPTEQQPRPAGAYHAVT